jgi:hypothetical protein
MDAEARLLPLLFACTSQAQFRSES